MVLRESFHRNLVQKLWEKTKGNMLMVVRYFLGHQSKSSFQRISAGYVLISCLSLDSPC